MLWHTIVAGFHGTLSLLFLAAYYDRYWRHRDCFNDLGRCYVSGEGVYLEQSGIVWGGLTMVFLVISACHVWRALSVRHRG